MNVGQLIPQAVYDVIARLIPGLTLLTTAFLLWEPCFATPLSFLARDGRSAFFPVSILTIIASYLIGLLTEGIWRILKRPPWLTQNSQEPESWIERIEFKEKDNARRDATEPISDYLTGEGSLKESLAKGEIPKVPIVYDILRMERPEVGANLVKLRAESHLCRYLALGWTVLLAVMLIEIVAKLRRAGPFCAFLAILDIKRLALALTLLAVALVFWTLWRRRYKLYLWSLYNHWLFFKYGTGFSHSRQKS